jgi:hypothetical protein
MRALILAILRLGYYEHRALANHISLAIFPGPAICLEEGAFPIVPTLLVPPGNSGCLPEEAECRFK